MSPVKSNPASASVSGFPLVIGGATDALATTAVLYDIICPFDGRITRVDILDTAAITRSNTDYMKVTVTNLGTAGAGTTVMACGSTEIYHATNQPLGMAADPVGYVPKSIPFQNASGVATADSAQKFSAGDVLQVKAEAGSSGTFTAGQVIVRAVQGA